MKTLITPCLEQGKLSGMHFEMWHSTFLETQKHQIILNFWNT